PLLETQIVVDSREAGASSSPVVVQQEPRSVDGSVVVELDGPLERLERLDGPVDALEQDSVVEPGGRIIRVKVFGQPELIGSEEGFPLLVVGLAEIAAQHGIPGVQADRDLDLALTFLEMTAPDLGQTQTQPRQGRRLIELDRALTSLACFAPPHLVQGGEAEHGLRSCVA